MKGSVLSIFLLFQLMVALSLWMVVCCRDFCYPNGWYVLEDLLCNDMYDICMQCFQGSRGVNKKLLEFGCSLIEETSCH